VNPVYTIAPGTRVAVSVRGSEFKFVTLLSQIQFDAPPELTDNESIFTDGNRRTRVNRSDVIVTMIAGQGRLAELRDGK
jgi:hypothetical protein